MNTLLAGGEVSFHHFVVFVFKHHRIVNRFISGARIVRRRRIYWFNACMQTGIMCLRLNSLKFTLFIDHRRRKKQTFYWTLMTSYIATLWNKSVDSFRFVSMEFLTNSFDFFSRKVRLNLHVVFTMNPASPDFHNRSATSPGLTLYEHIVYILFFNCLNQRFVVLALFNRCVIDWFGDWPDMAFHQVRSMFRIFFFLIFRFVIGCIRVYAKRRFGWSKLCCGKLKFIFSLLSFLFLLRKLMYSRCHSMLHQ